MFGSRLVTIADGRRAAVVDVDVDVLDDDDEVLDELDDDEVDVVVVGWIGATKTSSESCPQHQM